MGVWWEGQPEEQEARAKTEFGAGRDCTVPRKLSEKRAHVSKGE